MVSDFYFFLSLLVFFCVLFCFLYLCLNFVIAQLGGRSDGNSLFLTGTHILCGYVYDTVGVDIEGYFDLRDTTRSWSNTGQLESAQSDIACCHFSFTLHYVNVYCSLVVSCGGEDLALLGRNGCISFNQSGCYAAQSFDGQGQRSYVQQQDVVYFTSQYACLDCSTCSYTFVRVDALEWFLAGYSLYCFLYSRDSGGTAYQDYLIDVGSGNTGVCHSLSHWFNGSFYQVGSQLFELGSGDIHVHVQRTVCSYSDERQIDVGGSCTGQFLLCLFSSFLQSLMSHLVSSQVYTVFLCKGVCQEVQQCVVEVIAAQVGVTVGSQYTEHTVCQFQDGYVEGTAAQVVNQNLVFAFFLIQAVSQGSCSWFVYDSLNVQTCDSAGVLGCLLLCIGEVSRNGDNCFCYLFAQVAFCIVLQLGQNHCRDVLWSVVLTVDGNLVVFTHVSLDGRDGSVRVGDCLSLSSFANQSFSVLCEANYGWSCSIAFCVGDYYRFAAFQYCNARVCCS